MVKSKFIVSKIVFLVCLVVIARAMIICITRLGVACPPNDVCNLAGKKVELVGTVISLPQERLEKMIVSVKPRKIVSPSWGEGFNSGVIQVTLPHTRHSLFYGDQVFIKGKIKLPERDSQDNFSYPLYLAGQGIFSIVYNPEISQKISQDAFWELTVLERSLRKLYLFRERIRGSLNGYLPEPDAAIMNAMIIGDQGSIPLKTRSVFSQTGIVHILSVSGAHITLFLAIWVFVLGKFFSRRGVVFISAAGGVAAYVILTGAPGCAIRAGVMGILAFLALSGGRLANYKALFWLSLAFLLLLNPLSLIADIGFQLSYLAIFGMIYLFPALDKTFIWGREGFFWKMARIVLLSISISLTTSPLVLYYFGLVSWVAVAANLLLLPFFSLLLPLGFLLGAAALVMASLDNFIWIKFWSLFPKILGNFLHLIFYLVYKIAGWLRAVPFSYSQGSAKIGWVAVYYLLLLGAISIFRRFFRKNIFPRRLNYFKSEFFLETPRSRFWGLLRTYKLRRYLKKKISFIFQDKTFKYCLIVWLLAIGGPFAASFSYLYSSSRPPRLIMLDVEQGDAILLNWPQFQLQILLDGGPGRRILAELGETLPFYDKKIELITLSHPHQDHLEGLLSLLERYEVSRVVVNSLPRKNYTEEENFTFLQKVFWSALIKKEIPVTIAKKGQKVFLNSGSAKIAELEFLAPLFDYSKYGTIAGNNQSAVLKMDYPKQILFMGDAGKEVEKQLLAHASPNIRSEVLKISHHGSRFSTSNEFLKAVEPRTALISAGKNNLYGHPTASTIKKLKERDIQVFRTDIDGKVEINL